MFICIGVGGGGGEVSSKIMLKFELFDAFLCRVAHEKRVR